MNKRALKLNKRTHLYHERQIDINSIYLRDLQLIKELSYKLESSLIE